MTFVVLEIKLPGFGIIMLLTSKRVNRSIIGLVFVRYCGLVLASGQV